jgi:hypothetical protein
MPRPGNSNLFRCFPGVASGKFNQPVIMEKAVNKTSKSFFAQVFYGLLCRVQETAICSAVFLAWRPASLTSR